MKIAIIYIAILSLASSSIFAQYPEMYAPFYKDQRVLPPKFNLVEGAKNSFVNKTDYKLSYFILNNDCSFVYYSSSAVAYDLTLGKFKTDNRYIWFEWDSVKTIQAVHDSVLYRKYFPKYVPTPFKIVNAQYIFNKDRQKFKLPNRYDVLELFFSPEQVFSHGIVVDSLRDFLNPIYFDTKKNIVILNTRKKKDIIFPLDSLWGYKYVLYGYKSPIGRVRGNPVLPLDLAVLQCVTGMVIYRSSPGKHRYYYFSTGLDTKVYDLTLDNLKYAYSGNTRFRRLLDTEFKNSVWTNINTFNSQNGKFKLIELYEKSIN